MNENKSFLLKNGRIIDYETKLDLDADLLVQDGLIKEIAAGITPPEDAEVVDVSGKWIFPGLVDMHVHLREPGEEYKETIGTGSMAAAAGGFTTIACMPNTRPPNDNSGITKFIIEQAAAFGKCRVLPVAAVTKGQRGEDLTEFADLLSAGAVAFSDDGLPVKNPAVMRLALEYSLNFKTLIISHAEDLELSGEGCMNEGAMSTKLGLKGIPAAAEEIAIFRDIRLAELTGARLHIAHVSTKGSLEIIRAAKERGVKVTAETAPHYFSLTEEAVDGYNTLAKMNPPLRTEEDRRAVIHGLRDGTLDVIATDHAPHSSLEKECEFQLAANGIIGLETALPLALEILVRQEGFSPQEIVRLMSRNPSRILEIKGGSLKTGSSADITVIDPEDEFCVTEDSLHSKSSNSPFLGRTFCGRTILTLLAGRPVFDLYGICRKTLSS